MAGIRKTDPRLWSSLAVMRGSVGLSSLHFCVPTVLWLPHQPKHLDLNGNEFTLPNFKLRDIHAAIPRNCFRKSISTTLYYVSRDLCYFLLTAGITQIFVPLIPNLYLRFLAYTFHTLLSGLILTGIWILGHEAGHNTLTPSPTINSTIGFILHSLLLTPYFSFQATHAKHHQATNDLKNDTVFVPQSRAQWIEFFFGRDANPKSPVFAELAEDAPLVSLWHCILHQLLGWPGYLVDNATGVESKHGFPYASHFWFFPSSLLFNDSQLVGVFLSDLGIGCMAYILWRCVLTFGWWNMGIYYFLPYIWLNHWIVAITYCQHTSAIIPHYTPEVHTFILGALSTVDRPNSFLFSIPLPPNPWRSAISINIDEIFWHNMNSTHVLHHLCSTIPFYHAAEATEAVRPLLGKHYHSDSTPLWKALWDSQKNCQFVEESVGMDGSGVFMWRNLHNGGKNSAEGMRDSKEEERAIGFAKSFLRCLFFDKGLVIPPPKW
ncbi:hypothetical protein L207DRAFT_556001 [Hyaloscypha variabilis F]|uniref:Fatty acid desaturase domain-containing protein n=1 Tax=Hyaloscypha variabilis (strain UAMH 11265 / GT02V1 / F) TaxID=1149755 RepID=A0A2J6RGK6_HYAVF|nr:hypothetical protein L207DRAFT_556001 [Hyaloscypha variabilis F]